MNIEFYSWNENGYAIVEAYAGTNRPVHTLKVPMEQLYHEEVSYILDSEDWSDESENYEHTFETDWNNFAAGDTPKLVAWWLATLPEARPKNRRRSWTPRKNKTLFWNWLRSLTVLVKMKRN